ncbi:MAG: hypothetical protein QOE14_60 [Humisphaera sp.]|nr:hypothetical protein [Humisphaera sp.]
MTAHTGDEFNPLRHPAIFNSPQMLSLESAWVQHIPLAFLIIELTRPRVLVELGAHYGDSYCAFCQAVAHAKTQTRCFAVDTWRGDVHAGFYDASILATLKSHHDPLYGGFSTLLQADFDSAVKQFDDGSIDLLHIDGHHTYESVRHDFDTWLTKMSPRGVVLLHDTSARHDPSFGVWRVWAELAAQYPSFEFPHAHGLGIVAVGTDPPADVMGFLRSANANPAVTRTFFTEIGNRIFDLQVLLKTTHHLVRQWNILSQWRQVTKQPTLPTITAEQMFANPEPLAAAISRELEQLAQDDLNLRQRLQPGKS